MFKNFRNEINKKFNELKNEELYVTDVSGDGLWGVYLLSFPKEMNKIFRERTTHDCQACKRFIKHAGNIVAIKDNNLVSIWDINIGGKYQVVADALSKKVKSAKIKNVFLTYEKTIGVKENKQLLENGEVLNWSHFYISPSKNSIKPKHNIDSILSEKRTNKEVFHRGLTEITIDAAEIVIDLIEQGSLYRGEENYKTVKDFLDYKKEFEKIKNKDNYVWQVSQKATIAKIKNTSIGKLLLDISNGVDLDIAVRSFEKIVAPENYKRPTAIVTKGMVIKAKEKLEELGFIDSLKRRMATKNDLTINNVIFANRDTKNKLSDNVFDEIIETIPEKVKNYEKVDVVTIEDFINKILPKAKKVEAYFENKHENNLVSLVAPTDFNSRPMFKWSNNFSWSYKGELTDSIKEKVKRAGGNVEGDFRCSLSWYNTDDLDIHLIEPSGNEIYYGDKYSRRSGGNLDVDMNVSTPVRNAVENITFPSASKMLEGKYKVFVVNYKKRENADIGFEVEIEYQGDVYNFAYEKAIESCKNVTVAEFELTKKGIKFLKTLKQKNIQKEIWNISTQKFHNIEMIMFSPNYWDENKTGNKHYFFMLESCNNNEPVRGFYNEFLDNKLNEHRKVFEILGSKTKIKPTQDQLSGLGFSATKRNELLVKVTGNFIRLLKVKF